METGRQCLLRTSTLPNGLTVHCVSREDVSFIYDEVFLQRGYLQHDVQLRPGDTVVDIGSNIGLFTLYAAEAVGHEGKVVAVEPLPQLHRAAVLNTAAHAAWCAGRGMRPAAVHLEQCGASDGSEDCARFTLYSKASGWSSMVPDEAETEANMGIFLRATLRGDRRGLPPGLLAVAASWLLRLGPTWLYNLVWRWYVRRMMGPKVEVTCRLITVSDLIERHSLKRVDLLKVDVERAELAVLRGVHPTLWPRIQQVTMEAHDWPSGRLVEILALLRGPAAFRRVTAEQSVSLKGTTLWNIWATR